MPTHQSVQGSIGWAGSHLLQGGLKVTADAAARTAARKRSAAHADGCRHAAAAQQLPVHIKCCHLVDEHAQPQLLPVLLFVACFVCGTGSQQHNRRGQHTASSTHVVPPAWRKHPVCVLCPILAIAPTLRWKTAAKGVESALSCRCQGTRSRPGMAQPGCLPSLRLRRPRHQAAAAQSDRSAAARFAVWQQSWFTFVTVRRACGLAQRWMEKRPLPHQI